MDRATRKEDVERAYELQAKAGLAGAARATVLGLGMAVLGHYTWPTFRSVSSQPLRAAALTPAVHGPPTVCLGGKHYRSKASWSPSVCPKMFAPRSRALMPCLLGTVFGLVLGAENALLAHEAERRQTEGAIRKQARIELARRGLVPTETEIAKWKAEQFAARQADLDAAQAQGTD